MFNIFNKKVLPVYTYNNDKNVLTSIHNNIKHTKRLTQEQLDYLENISPSEKYAIILLFNSCHNYIIDFIKDGVRPRSHTV